MDNTDVTGGTRYSRGKPKLVGMPLLGLAEVAGSTRLAAYAAVVYDVRNEAKLKRAIKFIDAPWHEVADVTAYGAEKYTMFDWREGQSFATLLNSAGRHIMAMGGVDPESGLTHRAHAAWNLLVLLEWVITDRWEFDDITPEYGRTAE